MRITQAQIWERIDWYEREFGFSRHSGWAQVIPDLKPPQPGSIELPRAVAYGAYMELCSLVGL